MRIKDKVAIITGAGRGIGEAIARRFAAEGAKVALCDIDEANAKRVADDLCREGGVAEGFVVNVRDSLQVKNMVKKVIEEFGTVDILVNNAGITQDAMVHKMTEEQWDIVIDVNLKGAFRFSQAVIPIMREKGYGKIVNISSTSRNGNIGQTNYSASKAGLVGMTQTLAKELASKRINVNAIAPGTIETEMYALVPENIRQMANSLTPLKRPGLPEEVSSVCLFLASDEASYVTGQVINCDGGMFMS
ncbi:3-oxoacyl-ACP reductase FabG [Desulfosporosinus metallidurans]|uniref:3-oxoacyl-[acyl-carrier protein] reductase n=1 Tax=Desulfosporosinus metallidurans TaxID=1888891 RepID=A0A1Q8QKQ8_9FIRM|nr:3-oxoacyl-ACP reductase FabG [Desulfosporosinus metallidurans]OLN27927.1 3-oxoacyl-[acyl-carrier protein] reductase [Desulfosporosinus metallidurans]